MKIDLESPFKEIWKQGYLVVNPEGRKNVCLVNSKSHRTTISYARYLYSVSIGSIVEPNMEVDHIDNDKTNDVIDNLQLLQKRENTQKARRVSKQRTMTRHGTLSCYRYCKCDTCKLGKKLYSAGRVDEYRKLVA